MSSLQQYSNNFWFFLDVLIHHQIFNWHDGVVVRASASQSVDLGFISLVESYQKI